MEGMINYNDLSCLRLADIYDNYGNLDKSKIDNIIKAFMHYVTQYAKRGYVDNLVGIPPFSKIASGTKIRLEWDNDMLCYINRDFYEIRVYERMIVIDDENTDYFSISHHNILSDTAQTIVRKFMDRKEDIVWVYDESDCPILTVEELSDKKYLLRYKDGSGNSVLDMEVKYSIW